MPVAAVCCNMGAWGAMLENTLFQQVHPASDWLHLDVTGPPTGTHQILIFSILGVILGLSWEALWNRFSDFPMI